MFCLSAIFTILLNSFVLRVELYCIKVENSFGSDIDMRLEKIDKNAQLRFVRC